MRKNAIWAATLTIPWIVGCQGTSTPDPAQVAQYRSQFMLSEEPDEVDGVLDVRERLLGISDNGGEATPPSGGQSVAIVGRIGGLPNPWGSAEPAYPWVPGEARFFLADPAAALEVQDHSHGHGEDESCPFCANAADSKALAVIRFADTEGRTIKIDGRHLFELKGEETVVVRGAAKMIGEGEEALLVVDANGIYVRR